METRTFNVSDETIRQNKRVLLVVKMAVPILSALLFLLTLMGRGNLPPVSVLWPNLIIFALAMAIFEATMFIGPPILYRKIKEAKLTLTGDGLERGGGKFTEKVNYQDINRLDIRESSSGKVIFVRGWAAGKRSWILHGFEGMEAIARQLEANLPAGAVIRRSTRRIDWTNPFVLVATLTVTMVVTVLSMFAIRDLGRNAYKVFMAFLFLLQAVIQLFFRPLSTARGKRFKMFETIFGIFCLLLAIGWVALLFD